MAYRVAERKYQIENMWDIHHEIVRLAVIGLKHVEIAKHLGVSAAMVSYTLRSRIVQDKINALRKERDARATDIAREIQELAPAAVSVLNDLLECELPNIRLRAAQDVLDRAGFAPVRTIQTQNVHTYLSREDIDEIKSRARGIGLLADQANSNNSNIVIDAEA